MKPVYDPLTGRTTAAPKSRTMRALPAADVRELFELAREHAPALYRRMVSGNFVRAKVLLERRR